MIGRVINAWLSFDGTGLEKGLTQLPKSASLPQLKSINCVDQNLAVANVSEIARWFPRREIEYFPLRS